MELQGKVIAVLPEKTGTNARGEWKVQEYVVETHDQYPRKMVFSVFGADRISRFNIQLGQEVTVSFDIDAHEYQGRWFNSVRAWNIQRIDPNAVAGAMGAMQPGAAPFPPMGAAPQAAAPAAGATARFPPTQPAAPAAGGSADDHPF